MIQLPSLYDHQQVTIDAAREALNRSRRVVMCAPPGFGKSRCAKWMLGSMVNRWWDSFRQGEKPAGKSGYGLFTVHRRGLVDNASDSFSESPAIEHGVLMADRKPNGGCNIQVASIDSLLSWYCEGGVYSSDITYDFIVYDETHSHLTKLRTFLEVHDAKRESLGLKRAYLLGLSATPQHKELGDVYQEIINGPEPKWLIEQGWLKQFRYFQATQGQLGKLVRRGDEYTKDSVAAAMEGLAGDLVRDWKRLAEGRATVGFFPRRSHAKEACELLNNAGILAEYVDGNTSDENRQDIFRQLNENEIDYICNVGVVERGTDIPRVSCVQLCTAIGSVVRHKQMIGRGSRPHPDWSDCIVIDHADNVRRNGFFEDNVDWSLDWNTRPSKEHATRPTIECPTPGCGAIYRGGKCMKCGYEPTVRERKAQGLVFSGSELQEVKQDKPKKAKKAKTNKRLIIDAIYRASKKGSTFAAACVMARRAAKDQGTSFRMPREFEVAGHVFRPVPFGHEDNHQRVAKVYGFAKNDFSDDANPYLVAREGADA